MQKENTFPEDVSIFQRQQIGLGGHQPTFTAAADSLSGRKVQVLSSAGLSAIVVLKSQTQPHHCLGFTSQPCTHGWLDPLNWPGSKYVMD